MLGFRANIKGFERVSLYLAMALKNFRINAANSAQKFLKVAYNKPSVVFAENVS